MNFGSKIKELLDERNMTQKQLAEELNVGVTTLGNYIRGIREPDYNILCKIALYFGVSTDMLLGLPPAQRSLSQDTAILERFQRLSARDRALLLDIADCMLRETNKTGDGSLS